MSYNKLPKKLGEVSGSYRFKLSNSGNKRADAKKRANPGGMEMYVVK